MKVHLCVAGNTPATPAETETERPASCVAVRLGTHDRFGADVIVLHNPECGMMAGDKKSTLLSKPNSASKFGEMFVDAYMSPASQEPPGKKSPHRASVR